MSKFLEECEVKSPTERGDLLKTTFANIHADSAVSGQTVAPTDPAVDPEGHFTCFVQAPEAGFRQRASEAAVSVTDGMDSSTGMRLVELNGSRGGPIDRGECENLLHVRHCLCFVLLLVLCVDLGYGKVCERTVYNPITEHVFRYVGSGRPRSTFTLKINEWISFSTSIKVSSD